MYFTKIRLINYRNFLNISIDFDSNLNIFIGDNAQGKTNILEAMTMLVRGSSYKTNNDKQLINWDNNVSCLFGEINKNDESFEVNISLEKNVESFNKIKLTKVIKINQNIQKKSILNKEFKGVVFSPEHLQIIKGSPSLRRRFLDEQISQIYPLYQRYLSGYNRILGHRNNILRRGDNRREVRENLLIWDPQIIKRGSFLILTRSRFLKKMNYLANKFYQEITKGKENLKLSYQNNVIENLKEEEISLINKAFKDKIERYKKKEIDYKTTLYGPHRDDFLVFVNNANVAFYGSQGQQRTSILSLKLGELDLIKEREGVYPILLLDDVMSELDEERRHFLLELIINKKVQTFITSINLNYFNNDIMKKGKIFKVEGGKVSVL
ncbi:MAG TPA: DNA replication/repair protein RecF [Candidatus Atribacteria bacterium]|nr:DNA replication/repair protein RecF [Candidatus Atribacteria bacterium]